MITLYHYYRSSASYRVRIALALKSIKWNAIPIDLADGEHLSAEYAEIAPAQLVPALVNGSATISQSLAIIEYLDEICPGPPLLPSSPKEKAYVREIALDISCEVHPLNNRRVLDFLQNSVGMSETEVKIWYRHWTEIGLRTVETKLVRAGRIGSFCLGEKPTVADCFLVPQIFNAKRFHCDLRSFPNVMRTFDNCMALEAFSSTQPSAYDPAAPK